MNGKTAKKLRRLSKAFSQMQNPENNPQTADEIYQQLKKIHINGNKKKQKAAARIIPTTEK